MKQLEMLARRLMTCRRTGNRMTYRTVLECAGILSQARSVAGRGFTSWLREKGHMDPMTARRHLAVGRFVRENRALTREISTLSVAKVYALTTLDANIARRTLTGRDRFSKPLNLLSDIQFRREFRERFPRFTKRRHRQHAFQELYGALCRTVRAAGNARRFLHRFTPEQKRRINRRVRDILGSLSKAMAS